MKSIVKVSFNQVSGGQGPKFYTFFTDLILAKKDQVIVRCATGYQVCTVEELDVTDEKGVASRWVVQKIDTSVVEKRIANEKRAAVLKKALMEKKNKFEALKAWELLAINDPEADAMLDELKSLES